MTMDFPTAVRICLTQKYAGFQGRASRSEYWWFFLAFFIGAVITQLIWWGFYLVFALALACPMLAAGFRRLQDTGRAGYLIAVPFILSLIPSPTPTEFTSQSFFLTGQMPDFGTLALVGLLVTLQVVVSLLFLWWLTRPSQPDTNAYGPPPAPFS